MIFIFQRNKKQNEQLDEIERQVSEVHQKNINKIAETREKVDTLNTVLKQNHIVFQLAHVIGHRD